MASKLLCGSRQTLFKLMSSLLQCPELSGPPGDVCTCRHPSKQQSWTRKESPRAQECSTSVALCIPAVYTIHRAGRCPSGSRLGVFCPTVILALKMVMFAQQRTFASREELSEVEARLLVLRGHLASVELLTSSTQGQEWEMKLSLSHSDSWEDGVQTRPMVPRGREGEVSGHWLPSAQTSEHSPNHKVLQEQRLWELSLHAITLAQNSPAYPYPRPDVTS